MLKEIVRRHGEVHRTKSKKRAEVNIYPEHIGLPGGPTLSADRGRSAVYRRDASGDSEKIKNIPAVYCDTRWYPT